MYGTALAGIARRATSAADADATPKVKTATLASKIVFMTHTSLVPIWNGRAIAPSPDCDHNAEAELGFLGSLRGIDRQTPLVRGNKPAKFGSDWPQICRFGVASENAAADAFAPQWRPPTRWICPRNEINTVRERLRRKFHAPKRKTPGTRPGVCRLDHASQLRSDN
jgi:hypothetical protein